MDWPWTSSYFREVIDADEEIFVVFSRPPKPTDLGMIDSKATTMEIDVAGCTLEIRQSPSLLQSDRHEGTTGAGISNPIGLHGSDFDLPIPLNLIAVAWRSSILFSELVAYLLAGAQLQKPAAKKTFNVFEVGCGCSGIVALCLAKYTARYVATDQAYVRKYFEENISLNMSSTATVTEKPTHQKRRAAKRPTTAESGATGVPLVFEELDWDAAGDERGLVALLERHFQPVEALDLIVSNDCVYNESLVRPFVETCASICRLCRNSDKRPLLIVGQQLRSHSVFELWLSSMMSQFLMWAVDMPTELLPSREVGSTNFVCYAALLK